ncbi:MAG: nicotinate-nucleotide--dimethylbenzimidazole phosphoribosyltransferase [Rhodospirillales bacterium]|nr:nicotinate-nucleotide--dimethylbenzimidazole phosphoribosyltransferase [Rhodospirillales bacterium]
MLPPVIQNLDDIHQALQSLPGGDADTANKAAEREPQLTKPPGSLGRLEDISQWLCRWQGRHPPTMGAPRAQIFAGNHGVVKQGVSAYPAEVTAQMVANFEAGGGAVNQLCNAFGVGFTIDALALDRPTEDFTNAPAMTESECVDAFVFGMGTVVDGTDVLCLGEMGIGNTTSAAALSMALYGGEAQEWTGTGTGVQGPALDRKTAVVAKAVACHTGATSEPLQILCRLGGRELAAIAGAVLAARYRGVPVLLYGYVSTAAAAPLEAACPGALDHCRAGHVSTEPGHRRLLDKLGMTPLLDLNMRLGEASGAVLAVAILRGAVACHNGMATFAKAAVSGKRD